ncbi:DUF2330 domain-containing protein [Pseudenhygromyxa sp. WMMC2535]|uniref:DUF2330 domain-containing protein n=1 Tax=Pseudenhygromyxa sp. WMMC2535 TaxID=2712867 RepID=UPI001555CEAE|nr:DUF2330 domain-containing protein [Pseudenhygromyxa sp. WMMC2535]NVB40789.1 DUF2330 domain-containing protein [Pseudenhygromyxa sp. WMMC2535]
MDRLQHLAPHLLVVATAFSLPMLLGQEAEACGGTFCDTGPQAMPVDQTGENIIFHIGEDRVEAHIQIQYDPETTAEKFAWVIPVSALPEFEVGSQLLFDATLAGSVPSYGLSVSSDFCGDDDTIQVADSGGGDDVGDDEGGGENGAPDVVFTDTVGAFEIAVLDGGTVEGVMQWLADNGYQQDPASEPILAEYLAEEFLFVALKLSNDAAVGEIHPVVIRYPGTESCVPVRLTRIAAAEDMDIRVFFYQDGRTVPINYRHVLVNPLKIDWFNNADNYKEVVSLAVDADSADGNAFVTEYAGTSQVVDTETIYSAQWSGEPFAALTDSPIGAIELLENQGLAVCDSDWDEVCTFVHPLLEGIVSEFIPVPEGVVPVNFYSCLECYEELIDLAAWDAAAFAAKLDERVVAPSKNAAELVTANPYLTRMYTTISPGEMNDDPMFRINTTLPDVQAVRIASQANHCNGSATLTLPDGREVIFPDSSDLDWPDFSDEMPWVEDVDQEGMAQNAPLISLVDNTEAIDTLLEEHNSQQAKLIPELDSAGCVCTVSEGRERDWLLGLAALGLLGLVRRRRRG